MTQGVLFDIEPKAKEPELFDTIMSQLEEMSRDAERTNRKLEKMILSLHPECKNMAEVNLVLNPPKQIIKQPEIILSMEAIEVLKKCTVTDNIVKLPDQQLDRKDYMAVKNKLELIGGKWKGGKVQGFEFKEDPTEMLAQISNGEDRNLKKEYQFFATPKELADKLVLLAEINELEQHGFGEILEPSAGQGAIVKAIHEATGGSCVHCYELMPINQTFIKKINGAILLGDDFLKHPEHLKFDRIVANPPFAKNQDIDHIRKMYQCLKPNGKMVSISSKHWQISSNKKETDFRNWLKEVDAEIEEINNGEFKESGTAVGGLIIVIKKAA